MSLLLSRAALLSFFLALLVTLVVWLTPTRMLSRGQHGLAVVTTVAPLTNIALNVGGQRIDLRQIVPDGVDSHTFEPSPADARAISEADLIILNGLHLEESTLELAEANKKASGRVLLLADNTITRDEWRFDFSFPEEEGEPNPHLWMNPAHAMRYAEMIRDQLVELDPHNAEYYQENTARFLLRVEQLDSAIAAAIGTIPPGNRKLLTYHDSFAYFAPRYGLTVIGAIQPSDFSEPSPREVADLVEQLKAEGVPAIFGSEVFPSRVLERIGREVGVTYVDALRDDDLPGAADAAEHTYIGMMLENVKTMTTALGGDPSALESVDPTNSYRR
jgi:ABC-type Zn uptake system ZnuABC Zn-binding protein ZnuA